MCESVCVSVRVCVCERERDNVSVFECNVCFYPCMK